MTSPARLLVLVLLCCFGASCGWKSCGIDEGGGICPEDNTCCSTGAEGVSTCVTAQRNGTSSCCTDDGTGLTGCRPGYRCTSSPDDSGESHYWCELIDKNDDEEPALLPRYKLCNVPEEAIKLQTFDVVPQLPRMAYFSSMGAIDDQSEKVKLQQRKVSQIMIVVHGSGRSAADYLCCGISSVPEERRAEGSVMVISPFFMTPGDEPTDEQTNTTFLRWYEDGPIPHTWRYGADSVVGNISSYSVMDSMVERILADFGRFPSLKRIIVTGHSAGGQLTHRWALTSNSPIWSPSFFGRHVHLRVVPANPRSFCYLDNRRYENHTLRVPSQERISKCPTYNTWEWGLDEGGRLPTPYFDRARSSGKEALVERYAYRDIVYLAGELDILPVRSECEDDDFQGKNRRERSSRFFRSLKEVYGREVHRRLLVRNVPHDHCLLYQSDAGQQALFGAPTEIVTASESPNSNLDTL